MATPISTEQFELMEDGDIVVVDDTTTDLPPGLPALPDFEPGVPLEPAGPVGTYPSDTPTRQPSSGSKIGTTALALIPAVATPMASALVPIMRSLAIEVLAELVVSEGPSILDSIGSSVNSRISTVATDRDASRGNTNPDGDMLDDVDRALQAAFGIVPDRGGTMQPAFCCSMLDKLTKDETRALQLAMEPGSEACVQLESASVNRLYFLCRAAQQPEMVRHCRTQACGCNTAPACSCTH